jgi:hypothetical protein
MADIHVSRGALGLWTPPPEVLAELEAAIS